MQDLFKAGPSRMQCLQSARKNTRIHPIVHGTMHRFPSNQHHEGREGTIAHHQHPTHMVLALKEVEDRTLAHCRCVLRKQAKD